MDGLKILKAPCTALPKTKICENIHLKRLFTTEYQKFQGFRLIIADSCENHQQAVFLPSIVLFTAKDKL